jgi:hypothetical protein
MKVRGKANLRQIDRVETAAVDVRGERSIARPQLRLVPDASEVHSERRAPSSCSEYRDVTNDSLP